MKTSWFTKENHQTAISHFQPIRTYCTVRRMSDTGSSGVDATHFFRLLWKRARSQEPDVKGVGKDHGIRAEHGAINLIWVQSRHFPWQMLRKIYYGLKGPILSLVSNIYLGVFLNNILSQMVLFMHKCTYKDHFLWPASASSEDSLHSCFLFIMNKWLQENTHCDLGKKEFWENSNWNEQKLWKLYKRRMLLPTI